MRHDSRAITLLIDGEAGTEALGAALADVLRAADFVALSGTLGAGKTALARATIKEWQRLEGLPVEDVPSPTFTLVQTYAGPAYDLWHADLYRLSDPREVDELGLLEEAADIAALVEWPDRMGDDLPPERLDIALSLPAGSEAATHRSVSLQGSGDWTGRLESLVAGVEAHPAVRRV